MNWLAKYVFVALVCAMLPTSVLALDFNVQAEKVRWQYVEYTKGEYISAKLPTGKTYGDAALLKLGLSSARDEDWFYALGATYMDSTAWTTEKWGTVQTNELSIKQQDIRLDMQYRMLDARFGVWLAHRQQTQQRQTFVINNVLTPQANEPIDEVITSNWAGLSFTARGGKVKQLEVHIDVGVPLSVNVDNPLFVEPFSKSSGYQAGVHFRWTLPKSEVGVSGLNLTLRYEYQELGGENKGAGIFWPYNRWQMATFGVLYAW